MLGWVSTASAQILVGWDNWIDSGSDNYPATDLNGATGLAVGTAPEGQFGWGNWNNSTYANGASADGTWGTSAEPGADSSTATSQAAVGLLNATSSGEMTFTITNTSGFTRDLTGFHFDGSEMLTKAAGSWTLSILAGSDVSIGEVQSGTLGVVRPMPSGGFDVDLTGLPDRRLEPGEVVIFELAFTGGVGDGSGGHNAMIDNVAVTASITLHVTTNADTGAGSLRQTIIDAPAGSTITFDPALDGQTITLTNGQLVIDKSLTIDASDLPGGIKMDANGLITNHRVMQVASGVTATLTNLHLSGGKVSTNAYPNNSGGGIYNQGTLTLSQSTLSGNSAEYGGGIDNHGTLTLDEATLSGNSAVDGGGIYNNVGAILTLNQSTLSENSADYSGGGIYNDGTLSLNQSTLSGNTAADFGGGLAGTVGGTVSLTNSIVSGNTAASGSNIVGSFSSNGINLTSSPPLLAPLGNYGGPTQTMPPLPGSPAINPAGGAATSGFATDQRGFPRIVGGIVDVGAVESGSPIADFLVTTANDENDGLAVGGVSLRDAIAFLPSGSSITFAPSLSGETITLTNGQLVIDKNLAIDASSLPDGLTISGNSASRVIHINGSTARRIVTLRGIRITGGRATISPGGGIFANHADLTLERCLVTGNIAGRGGAISVEGLAIDNRSGLWLRNTTVHANRAENQFPSGGGIYLSYCDSVVENSTITGNNGAYTNAAGVINTERDNQVDTAGGIRVYRSALTLANSVVANNGPSYQGAYGDDILAQVVDNASLYLNSVNFIGETDGFTPLTGSPPLTGNPQLAPLGDCGGPLPSRPPLPGSPLIDPAGGATTSDLSTDQRGLARILDGNLDGTAILDIGAVEFDPQSQPETFQVQITGPLAGSTGNPLQTTVSWEPPASGLPESYLVYLDGSLIATVEAPNVSHEISLPSVNGSHTLRIDTVFAGGTTIEGGAISFTTRASTIVDTLDDPGTSGNGLTSLRQAIADAQPGETITFAPSLSGETITLTNGQLVIDKNLTIDVLDLGDRLILNANEASRLFTIQAGMSLELLGLVLRDGSALSESVNVGGGIYNLGSLTLRGVVIENCMAGDGADGDPASPHGKGGGRGGAIFSSGSLVIEDSTLRNNSAGDGGDGLVGGTNSFGGGGGHGGGVFVSAGSATLRRTTLHDNLTGKGGNGGILGAIGGFGGSGGALYANGGSSLTLENTTIALNRAASAGLGVSDVTFFGAPAGNGGGLHLRGTAVLASVTIHGNRADGAGGHSSAALKGQGGGIFSNGASVTLRDSIIAGNTATSSGGPDYYLSFGNGPTTEGVNLFSDLAGSSLATSQHVLVGNPNLASLGDYGGPTLTMPPLLGSPVIDPAGGATTSGLSTDQRGFTRILDGNLDGAAVLDIGAVEFDPQSQPETFQVQITGPLAGSTGNPLQTTVSWEPPASGLPESYLVYLDDSLIATVAAPNVAHVISLPTGNLGYTLRVDTVFAGGTTIEGGAISFTTRASTIVDTLDDPGTSGNGLTSLRQAIADAQPEETITFAPGLSGETITLANGQFVIDKSLTIDASALSGGITINANEQSRVLKIDPGNTVALHGLTLTGGRVTGAYAANSGGAISLDQATLGLSNCTLTGNSAWNGGAIFNGQGALSLSACTLSDNSAINGGAIFSTGNFGSATLSLSACTLSGNSATSGGGIYSSGISGSATLSLSACTLSRQFRRVHRGGHLQHRHHTEPERVHALWQFRHKQRRWHLQRL
jgi:fibronectin-binding autotransporter adhesin